MNTGNTVFDLRFLTLVLFVGFWLINSGFSCDNNQAPIKQISTNKNMLSKNKIIFYMPTLEQNISYNDTVLNKKKILNRNYKSILKSYYLHKNYAVKHGDTLFYISWITGNNIHALAQNNNIQSPYNLRIGQIIQVNIKDNIKRVTNINSHLSFLHTKIHDRNLSINSSSSQMKFKSVVKKPFIKNLHNSNYLLGNQLVSSKEVNNRTQTKNSITSFSKFRKTFHRTIWIGIWHWPINNGKIIDNFSVSEGGNKGIDIAGSFGQPVTATASGRVVYAGNALHGYGNLIIIKHNNNYLSAYAHNDKMFVQENQKVQTGQKIATMGNTETNSVRLHFEIRYKGKSVNPLRYLPQR